MSAQRRLAAIMAVDVAGYSRLMGEDEAGTARSVREHRDAARPTVEAHGGRIVKTMGDGVLLEFPSVVAAVECGIAMQKLMIERNADVPETKRIVYRIGVNLGDVLIEGEDILGDGVNIAARLESIAEPGGICLSAIACESVRGKLAADFVDLGEQSLKNIARPVRVYAISAPRISSSSPPSGGEGRVRGAAPSYPTSPSRAVGAGPSLSPQWVERGNVAPRLSIVVLPFANIGGDPEQDYFVDGVTESLTTDLSRISGSFVIGRNTAFTYKGKAVDLKQIGRELNIRYVLEGSVQKGGNRLRVNVQLIEAESGAHLWAERFDKPVADLFDMQDEIVARLANQLGTELIAAEARRAERAPNPDSTDLYYQGAVWINKGWSPAFMAQARGFFERALALDRDNVEALVGLAYVDASAAVLYGEDRKKRLAAAEAGVTRALTLAPNHARAHLVLGIVNLWTNRSVEGIAELERALALDRNLAHAHGNIAVGKVYLGRGAEAEAHVGEALRLSPDDVNAYSWFTAAGYANVSIGRNEAAIAWLRRSIETNRNFPLTHFFLAAALAHLWRLDEARSAARAGLALDPTFTVRRLRESATGDHPVYLEQRARIADGIRKAGVPEG